MKVIDANLPGLKIIEPQVFGDDRGFFMETWNQLSFAEAGLDLDFVQDNHSRSMKGVLRGLHYQLRHPQGKLVRVIGGRAFDVVLDLRRSSPTFGRWEGFEISAANKRMLWVPPGFAHGFLALEDQTDFVYKCTDFYAPPDERAILWCDPDLSIQWPLNGMQPVVSTKDAAGAIFAEAEYYP